MSRSVVLQLAIFISAGLLVAWPSINYPWYVDDLHLIRVFSPNELRLSWTRSWDHDGFESPGYRPLTVLFNHARASIFGEARAAHRVFVIVVVAIYLVLVGFIGRRFRLTPSEMTLAGVMMVCAKYSSYQLTWISDGVHAAQGLLFALSALAILRWVESSHPGWIMTSVGFFVLSVLTREDSIAIVPVLAGAAVLYSRRQERWAMQRGGLTAYVVILAGISLSALLAREAILTPGNDPPWASARSVVLHPVQIVTLAGWTPLLLAVIFILIFALLLFIVFRSKREDANTAWLWLFFAFVASASGVVESRVNLLFYSITFYCIFVALVLTRYATGRVRLFGAWDRPLAIIVALCCIALPARESRRQQVNMAPGSVDVVLIDCDIARGGEWAAVISPLRRAEALRALDLLGLGAKDCSALWDESGALNTDARLPPGMFVPPLRFLSR